ncbi:hypothetical protein ACHAXR_013116 [Thalassiosira sp. AJA248-18]
MVAAVVIVVYYCLIPLFMSPSFSFALQRSFTFSFQHTRLGPSAAAAAYYYPLSTLRAGISTTSDDESSNNIMTSKKDGAIIMVLSPAKTLNLRPLAERDFSHDVTAATIAEINSKYDTEILCDADKTNLICNEMKGKTEGNLKSLLSLSASLAKVAHKFWTDFSLDHKTKDAAADFKPAMYTFSGPAYQGLSPSTCDTKSLSYLASHLFILDPVYGVLRSTQDMQAYRLEMGCRLFDAQVGKKKETLSMYWRESVTSYLGKELMNTATPPRILANLASEEYSSSIVISSLPRDTIFLNVVFRHQGRVLAVHAKKARGLMARYLSECGATTLQDISEFNLEGYSCEMLDGETYETVDRVGENVQIVRMIFDREDAPPAKGKEPKRAAAKKGGGSARSKRAKK